MRSKAPASSLLTIGRSPVVNFQWDIENTNNYYEQFSSIQIPKNDNNNPSSSSSSSSLSPTSSYESFPSNDEEFDQQKKNRSMCIYFIF